MVLVHGLLVILDSRRFSSVEVRRWVGPCTMGESRLTNWVEISRQVSRRYGIGTAKSGPQENRDFELDCKFLSRQAASVKSFLKFPAARR